MNLLLLGKIITCVSCVTYLPVKEIKTIAYSEDLTKGSSTGLAESDDCVFQVLGYNLGGQPSFSRAMANLRSGKKSRITDVAYASSASVDSVRYVNNVTAKHGGFSAVVFGKNCIEVSGAGHK